MAPGSRCPDLIIHCSCSLRCGKHDLQIRGRGYHRAVQAAHPSIRAHSFSSLANTALVPDISCATKKPSSTPPPDCNVDRARWPSTVCPLGSERSVGLLVSSSRVLRLCRGMVDPLIVPGGDLRLASLFSSRMPGDDHPALHSTHVQLVSCEKPGNRQGTRTKSRTARQVHFALVFDRAWH